jgi:NAD(P)-dependent dehydrogenase (short-subunit alcohol dehydrogenase family)
MKWTVEDMPSQKGRVAIVTGANSGIGYESARALARRGAHVVMACRNPDKGNDALERIRAESPAGSLELGELDLSRLRSVRPFVEGFTAAHSRLDLLVANAGVMMPPKRTQTEDGFELQIGTNHLGHFALVGRLLPLLNATDGARVVVVSSAAYKFATIDFDDLMWKRRRYSKVKAYSQSKLANLLFAYELQRRLEQAGASTIATAAHPGWTATNLQRDASFFRWLNPLLGMQPEQGALPTLYAATSPDAGGADFIGPDGMLEMRGWPTKVASTGASHDETAAQRLWGVSEQLTGVRYLSEQPKQAAEDERRVC